MKRLTHKSQPVFLIGLIILILFRIIHYFLGQGSTNSLTRVLKWVRFRRDGSSQQVPKPTTEGVILHPYLFSIFPSLSIVSDNAPLLSINRPIMTVGTGSVISTFLSVRLLTFLTRDKQKASQLVSLALLLGFSYGQVYDYLTINLERRNLRHRHLLMAWGLLAMGAIRFSLSEKENRHIYSTFLNTVSGCLVIIASLQIAKNKLDKTVKWQPQKLVNKNVYLRKTSPPPDIYYIILDGHASPTTLKEIYDYDIGAFTSRLRAKGFFIAEKSFSNYAMTMLSLASSLNMDYIDSLNSQIGFKEQDLYLPKRMIEENIVMGTLKSMGYKIIFLGSGFGITQGSRYADLEIDCGYVDETTGRFIQSTLMRVFADRNRLIVKDKYNRIIRMFSELEGIPESRGPKFTFAHIPAPQWPFLFDTNGNLFAGTNLSNAQLKEGYLNQLTFIDRKVEALIETILTRSKTAPIIILQGDHGPNFAFPIKHHYNLQNPPHEILREKMRIFNALHLPDGGSDFLHEALSPVNTFRLIFNRYFNADFTLLDDKSYFSTLDFPYRLSNVTDLVGSD